MKKILFLLLIVLTLCSCTKKEVKEKPKVKQEKEEVKEEVYVDNNNTPIAFYELKNNTLTKISSINKVLNVEEDIGVFSIYPSNENTINLTDSYANSFYNEWLKYKKDILKIGYNIKFNDISYNILSPNNTMDRGDYLMTYLYDDYANRNSSFYSHLESKDYNDNSLLTSIKLQSSTRCKEIDKITLTVFTYDTKDDFLNNEYRGNSKYSIEINTK
ncbi:MAG: hypothetical protein IJI43_01140 [Bacilli bacterium]|nr:hypothetical protein [Bacilli bacterium]